MIADRVNNGRHSGCRRRGKKKPLTLGSFFGFSSGYGGIGFAANVGGVVLDVAWVAGKDVEVIFGRGFLAAIRTETKDGDLNHETYQPHEKELGLRSPSDSRHENVTAFGLWFVYFGCFVV